MIQSVINQRRGLDYNIIKKTNKIRAIQKLTLKLSLKLTKKNNILYRVVSALLYRVVNAFA